MKLEFSEIRKYCHRHESGQYELLGILLLLHHILDFMSTRLKKRKILSHPKHVSNLF